VVRAIISKWSLPLLRDPPVLRGEELTGAGAPTRSALAELPFVRDELEKLIRSGAVRLATTEEQSLGLCLGNLVVARSKGELYGGGVWIDAPAPGSADERRAARDGTLAKRRLCYDVSSSLAPCEDLRGAEYNTVDWGDLVDAIRSRGPYVAREDFKSGFHHLEICERDQRYLAFRSPADGKLYVWTRLPFGLRSSPWLFALVARPLLEAMRKQGFAAFLQVDDLIMVGDSFGETWSAVREARRIAAELGVRLSPEKFVAPGVTNRVLGVIVHGREQVLEMPKLRRDRYARMLHDFAAVACAHGWTTRGVLERVTGVCAHIASFVPLLRHLLEPFYAILDGVYSRSSSGYVAPQQVVQLTRLSDITNAVAQWQAWLLKWDGYIPFGNFDSAQLRRSLWRGQWWRPPCRIDEAGAELALLTFLPRCLPDRHALVLRTDASATGGGGHCVLGRGQEWSFRCRWWEHERELGSAVRELRALLVGLRHLQREGKLRSIDRVRSIAWLSDSQAAVRAVRKGSSRIPGMAAALRSLASWELQTAWRVWAFWVPREDLSEADLLSRFWGDAGGQLYRGSRAVVTRLSGASSQLWLDGEESGVLALMHDTSQHGWRNAASALVGDRQ
jgi:hypothetical protein